MQRTLSVGAKVAVAALVAATMLLVTLAVPQQAHAATKTMKAGTYYSFTKSTDKGKIVVDKEGVITLTGKATTSSVWFRVGLYDAHGNLVGSVGTLTIHKTNPTSKKFAVSKGTYYVKSSDMSSSDSGSVKYTFTAIKQTLNCSKATATTLKKNTAKTFYNTQNYTFNRFYKIKLTKAQYVNLSLKGGYVYSYDYDYYYGYDYEVCVELFDARGNNVALDGEFNKCKTVNKLPKGTYYVCIYFEDWPDLHSTCISTIKWW